MSKKIKVFHDYCDHEYEPDCKDTGFIKPFAAKKLRHESILICATGKQSISYKALIIQILEVDGKISLAQFLGETDATKFDVASAPTPYVDFISARLAEEVIINEKKKVGYFSVKRNRIPFYDIAFGNNPPMDYSGEWTAGFPIECIKVDSGKLLELGKRYVALEVWGTGDDVQVIVETEKGKLPFYKERFKVIL